MNNTFSDKKTLIFLTLFSGSWLVSLFFKYEYPITYFSNPEIDTSLLNKMNHIASNFFHSFIIVSVYSLALIPIFKKIPFPLRSGFLFPLFIILISDILPFIELILHSENFLSYKRTTFVWNTRTDYNNYVSDTLNYSLVFFIILVFIFVFYNYKYIKKNLNQDTK